MPFIPFSAESLRLTASDLMNDVQGQLRSELRMILASSDKENAEHHREMVERQEKTLKLKDRQIIF